MSSAPKSKLLETSVTDTAQSVSDVSQRVNAALSAFVVFLIAAWGISWFLRTMLLKELADMRYEDFARDGTFWVFFSWAITGCMVAVLVYVVRARKAAATSMAQSTVEDFMSYLDRFKMLYDSSPVPYLLLTSKGIIDNPNKASVRFFETTDTALRGKNFFDSIVDSSERKDLIVLIKTKLERSVPINRQEFQLETARGDQRWVQFSMFVFESEAGRVGLATLVDITEQKEIDKVKTEFVSLASHQLRTPLTAIKWHVDLLKTSKKFQIADDVRGYIDKIYNGNERMIELVDTLLNISRIELGTLITEIKEVDIRDVGNDVIDEVAPAIAEKKQTLDKQFDDAACVVSTDARLIRIAVQNLMTNAIRYTPEGGSIMFGIRSTGTGAEITVTDTGCGIPPEAQHRIYTKMYRADNARKISAQGTGLGLYMTKAFVEKLGGSISFTSEVDKGTTFTIILPSHAPLQPTRTKE